MAWREEADVIKWWVVVGIAAITFKALAKVAAHKFNFPPVITGIIEA